MKKYTPILIAFCSLINIFSATAQTPEIKTDLPQVVPPSPTVAAFMKFEEVPLNNYTGLPDVSIPLYSVASHAPEITVDLSLKYHPNSVAVEEDASYVGLGWNLFGGGTISRSVRGGVADDVYVSGSSFARSRIGIYQTSGLGLYSNTYYEVMDIRNNIATATQAQIATVNKFYWAAYERGTFDTQHDLYQFNFMGHTGRFIIKKNYNTYEVVKLDNDNAIQINYDATAKTFTLYDDKGYKFVFDVKEWTNEFYASGYRYFDNTYGTSFSLQIPEYISAFHLSKIYDTNNKLVVEYKFNKDNELIPEGKIDGTVQDVYFNAIDEDTAIEIMQSQCGGVNAIEPKRTAVTTVRGVKTKKIKRINVIDKAKIDFTVVNGREDTNVPNGYRLSEIIIRTWADSLAIKKITLQHDYSTVNNITRMILTKVTESDPSSTISTSHEMSYKPATTGEYGKDYWGFFTQRPTNYPAVGPYRETNITACKVDLLQKMRLPAGGAVVFNFQPNTYSYIGSQEQTNYLDNPYNWDYSTRFGAFTTANSSADYVSLSSSTIDRYISFLPFINYGGPGTFTLMNETDGTTIASFGCGSSGTSCYNTPDYLLQANKVYKVRYQTFDMNGGSAGYTAKIKSAKTNLMQYFYGGGIRVETIGYFDDGEVPQDYYDNPASYPGFAPAKQKNFNYNKFDNASKSSGSLAFPKPVFEYVLTKHYYTTCIIGQMPFQFTYDYQFKYVTSYNNLKVLRTQGSDVGYKNVTVSETGNGYSRYEYKSPIDVPEESYVIQYPFYEAKNLDYKRGQVLNEKHYAQGASSPLTETIYGYSTVEGSVLTGLSVSSINNCRYAYTYSTPAAYYDKAYNCYYNNISTSCDNLCEYPSNYIANVDIRDYYGWTRLISKTVREYVGGQTVETKENYTYNDTNKQIASQTVETYGSAETINTQYFYNTYPNNNISSISRIETRKNNVLIDTQKMLYAIFPGNSAYLPATVQTAKSLRTLENRVQFVNYDEYGNLLEAKKENGSSVVYIWGYNKTLPIAMIENATYASISTTLITNAQTASNGTNEAALVTALNALRNGLPDAMVTTYIHKPLVGVTSTTDPKGDKTTFEYDVMGRLKYVKDKYGNLLSENEYHYKMP